MTPCLVFDLDDTLYLERDYVRGGFDAVGLHAERTHGIRGLSETCWALFRQGVRGDTFDRALRLLGVAPDPDLVRELVAAYRAHSPDIALLADARRCLEAAQEAAFLGIVTDGPAVSQRAKIAALGTDAFVDHTIVTAELGAEFAKPDPRAFALLETASGSRGTDCVYVADNPAKDFAGPKSLGWRTVRVRRRGGLHAALPSGPDVDRETTTLQGFGPPF